MGLNLTHGCFDGAYGRFNRFRNMLAIAAGYGLREVRSGIGLEMEVANIDFALFTDDTLKGNWEKIPDDPLMILFVHSDCEGVIHWEHAVALADRLEKLEVPEEWREYVHPFVRGLRYAARKKQDVEFL